MTKNKWRIPTISTDMYAEEFAKLLIDESNKTFFLQGKWGSGKTEYLKNVEKKAKDNLNFIYLELWKPDFNESLSRQLFDATHPKLAKRATIVGHALVTLTIVCSLILAIKGVISINLPNYAFTITTIIATVVINLFSLTKNKVINVDKILMSSSIKMLKGNPKICPNVLIIDDFDRLSQKTQGELYRLFNAIQQGRSSCRIIFVGNLNNIKDNKNNFLDKIIDQVIALPFVLNPQSFSNRLVEIISSNLNEDLSRVEIGKLFIYEHRTLREANHFLSYVEDEFCRQKKKGRVQTDQELLIIYLYLFHKDRYQKLYEDWQKEKNKKELSTIAYCMDSNNLLETKTATKQDDEDELEQYINKILDDTVKYPPEFQRHQVAYFLNEKSYIPTVNNLIISIQNDEIIKPLAYSKDSDQALYQEIFEFLNSVNLEDYIEEIIPQLAKAAIFAMHSEPRHEPNSLVTKILENCETRIENSLPEASYDKRDSKPIKDILSETHTIISNITKNLDIEMSLTEQFYIYRSCLLSFRSPESDYSVTRIFNSKDNRLISKYALTKYYSKKADEIENQKDFGKNLYDAEALLVQLCFFKSTSSNILDVSYYHLKIPPIKTKVAKIEQLADFEYVAFWDCYLGLGTRAKGERILNFEYKNEIYSDYVYDRYKKIKQAVCNLIQPNKSSKLDDLFDSKEWFHFILRIAAITHQYDLQNISSQQAIVIHINQLLSSYKNTKVEAIIKHRKSSINNERLKEVMQKLLVNVANDPYWTKKIK